MLKTSLLSYFKKNNKYFNKLIINTLRISF
nr:MAG TPA: hypothetical protein [Bacteriophage sp.]